MFFFSQTELGTISLHFYSMPLGALLRNDLLNALENKASTVHYSAAAYAFAICLKKKAPNAGKSYALGEVRLVILMCAILLSQLCMFSIYFGVDNGLQKSYSTFLFIFMASTI
jgi:hypothetical protein